MVELNGLTREDSYKPNSVCFTEVKEAAIYLGYLLPDTSSDLPEVLPGGHSGRHVRLSADTSA